jgi:hypothetical protein
MAQIMPHSAHLSADAIWPGDSQHSAPDLQATSHYAAELRQRGMANARVRNLGWRFRYGSPLVAAKLVSAAKPGESRPGRRRAR